MMTGTQRAILAQKKENQTHIPPCWSCSLHRLCANERLACKAYLNHIIYGLPEPQPGETHGTPSREIYDAIESNDVTRARSLT